MALNAQFHIFGGTPPRVTRATQQPFYIPFSTEMCFLHIPFIEK